jgi:hypothetical protein
MDKNFPILQITVEYSSKYVKTYDICKVEINKYKINYIITNENDDEVKAFCVGDIFIFIDFLKVNMTTTYLINNFKIKIIDTENNFLFGDEMTMYQVKREYKLLVSDINIWIDKYVKLFDNLHFE